jgi:hypothetical protein
VDEPNGASGWERHLQSLLLGLLTLAVLGFGSRTITSSENIAVLVEQVEAIKTDLKGKMSDRYTGNDHRAYSEFDALRAAHMQAQLERLEKRMKELEDRLNGDD